MEVLLMRITKKINNNVAIGLDSKGKEIVIFGKGIGFHEIPYELKDLSLITKTFYDIDSKYIGLLSEIPENIFNVSSKIVDYAKNKVECELNPSLAFTLADHINFAVERLKKSIDITNPLTSDIKHLYKVEMEIGYNALNIIEKDLQIRFPSGEAASIALHIINAEGEHNDMNDTIKVTKVLKEITKIVEECFNFNIDQDSMDYSRFVIHLKYFVQRVQKPKGKVSNDSKLLFQSLKAQYPDTYKCFKKIDDYFKNTLKYNYDEEEQLYLMVHINRLLCN
jgi:beta-glucoside operon transcriptional antiterminator